MRAEDLEGAYDPFGDTSPPPQPSVAPLERGGEEKGESGGGEEERGGREAAQAIHTQATHTHSHQLLDSKQDRREERQSSERNECNSSEHAHPQRNGECGKRHRDCEGESRQGDTVARDTVGDTRDTVADADASEPPPNVRSIYIWDLDETLIVFNSLLTDTYRSLSPSLSLSLACSISLSLSLSLSLCLSVCLSLSLSLSLGLSLSLDLWVRSRLVILIRASAI
jgi:hypothetical protein